MTAEAAIFNMKRQALRDGVTMAMMHPEREFPDPIQKAFPNVLDGEPDPFEVVIGFKGSWSCKAVWIDSLDCYKILMTHRLDRVDRILGMGHTREQAARMAFAEYEKLYPEWCRR